MKTNHYFSFVLMFALLFTSCNIEKKNCPQASSINDAILLTDQNNKTIDGKKKMKILSKYFQENGVNSKLDKFVIVAEENNSIVCNQGTKIFIKANTLVSAKTGEPIKGKVKLEVKEYYRMCDFLANNLTTTSDNTIIETGGTIYLQAKSEADGEKLAIKAGESVEIRFPTNTIKPGMMLFEGDSVANSINWNVGGLYRDTFYINSKYIDSTNTPATFPLGHSALDKFITESTVYPKGGHQNAAEGPVFVRFVVRRNGKISNIELLSKRNPSLDSAALQVVKKFPPFKPAVYNKKYCSYSITVPIKFYLWYNKYHPQYYINELQCEYLTGKRDPDFRPAIDDSTSTDKREYVLLTREFGWINCDRFLNLDLKQYTINTDASKVIVVFKKIKSIMQAYRIDGSNHTIKAPADEPVTIFAVKKGLQGELLYARKEATTGNLVERDFKYIKTNKEEFQKILENYKED